MRKLILALAVVVICLGMVGCAARTQQEIASLDYGTYPENYEAIVRGYMNNLLFDPYSAQFNFQGTPSQQYKPAGLLADEAYGWGGVVYINAKNRFGAYVGGKPYYYIIRYGNLIWMNEILTY